MGIQDRDYYRESPPGFARRPVAFGGVRFWSITTWLIAINIAVFVIDALLRVRLEGGGSIGLLWLWGFFSFDTAVSRLQLWRFFSFQFLHGGLGHIFFNMLGLYFFGPLVESHLGSRRYLAFYLLCGIAGPLAYLLIMVLGVLPMNTYTPMVGASAGLFGVLIAAAFVAPNTRVQLLFPPVDMPLRTMAWVYVGIAAFMVFTRGGNAGGEAAHLGGAAAGFLLIRNARFLNFAEHLTPSSLTRSLKRRRNGGGGDSNMKYHGWR